MRPFFTAPAEPHAAARHAPDAGQQAASDAVRAGASVIVTGAPGTGKTTAVVDCVEAAVRAGTPIDRIVTLAPTRQSAARLRQLLSDRIDVPSRGPLARTPHSLAFSLVGAKDAAAGRPLPSFISGPEQDRIIADLLAGHAAGEGKMPEWPDSMGPDVRATAGFRHELREVLMRALEWGIDSRRLAELARAADRPEWLACSTLLDEYLQVTTMQSENALDPAAVIAAAVDVLDDMSGDVDFADWRLPDLLVVDDLQDFTEAGARLIDVLVSRGAALLATGDPDATSQAFRGAEPTLPADADTRWAGAREFRRVTLPSSHRQTRSLREATGRVTERIGTAAGFRHRRPAASDDGEPVTVAVLPSTAGEHAYIVHTLRSAHLSRRPVAWKDMAVVVRSASILPGLRRELAAAGVPTDLAAPDLPLADEPAVRPLLMAIRMALRPDPTPTVDETLDLLTSRIGGADSVVMRRLRIALREQERAGGGTRGSDELLAEALGHPAGLDMLPHALTAPVRRVAAVLSAARENADGTAHEILWAAWQAAGVADSWARSALGDDAESLQTGADLDALMRLFAAAEKYSEVFVGLGAEGFGAHIEGQQVAEDTLAGRGRRDDAVTLLTASGASGREWDLVVVPAVQEGGWPNLTLRGSLLGAGDLADVLKARPRADPRAARREILDDELRTFTVAISRARRRLVVTAVRDDDQTPSPFLELVDPPDADDSPRPLTEVPRPLSLRGLAAALRSKLIAVIAEMPGGADAGTATSGGTVTPPDPLDGLSAEECAALLAELAGENVPGASVHDWYGQLTPSSTETLYAGEETVPVNPSQVEKFNECALRWFLETHGGTAADSVGQSVGNLVHELAHEFPTGGLEPMLHALGERLGGLPVESAWEAAQQRRRAESIVTKLNSYLVAHADILLGTEISFETRSGRALMRGRVDRVERGADGGLVIVDLKTGGTKPAGDELPRNAQLGSYQAAVEAGAFDELAGGPAVPAGAKLLQLATNKAASEQRQAALADDDDPDWATALVRATAEGMDSAAYTPTVNEHCPMCPVRSSCPLMSSGELP
ncbi:ATP-dependent DNA helicase [Spelaeicoccus albus]|uniref:DNA 3'-5' helicase n=1 Tax=Spelaeicoccus albus TaxID=1280376 RepID=A0A7Z0D3B8_9MICO|nr:ATP-dependent DNA helicase [Spelaeicoccus albus]NYI68102.1 superfamily I DNA/RNA helicase/RecB family exonuclease [Spelaeicoccus albus]